MVDVSKSIDNSEVVEKIDPKKVDLEDVIKQANFPEDYDLFDDELLDMIP